MQRVHPPHTPIVAHAHCGNQRSAFVEDPDALVTVRLTAHMQLQPLGIQGHGSGALLTERAIRKTYPARAGASAAARPFRPASHRRARTPDRAAAGTPPKACTSSLPMHQPSLAVEPSGCSSILPDAHRLSLATPAPHHKHAAKVDTSASGDKGPPFHAAFLQRKDTRQLS